MYGNHDRGASDGGLTNFEHRTVVLSLGVIMGTILAVKAVQIVRRWLHEELVDLEELVEPNGP
jgi:hypothetical protein